MKFTDYGPWTAIGLPKWPNIIPKLHSWSLAFNQQNIITYTYPSTPHVPQPVRLLLKGYPTKDIILNIITHPRYIIHLLHNQQIGSYALNSENS